MPLPIVPDLKQIQAKRIFVDRDKPRTIFADAVEHIPADGNELLVFYGVSGQGKSALSRKFKELIAGNKERFRHVHCGLVDFKEHRLDDPALIMLWLRDALADADSGLRFPVFDLAFAKYWNEAYPGQAMPEFRGGWLAEETGRAVIEAVPYVGSLLGRLAHNGIHAARRHFTKRDNDAVAKIFKDGETVPAFEIRGLLPELLASDLKNWRHREESARFVVLIDEYEQLFEKGELDQAARDNAYDKVIRDFVRHVSGVLVVIFGRERLEWKRFEPKWTEELEKVHHLLGGLSEKDADTFLREVPVSEPAVRKAIIESASTAEKGDAQRGVLPVMLDLAVDHYLSLKHDHQVPQPASFAINSPDFVVRRDALLRRFLRQYDPSLESTLKRLAVARRFDRAAAAFLIREFSTGFPLDRLRDLENLSFVDKLPDGDASLHEVIRAGLMAQLDPYDLRRTEAALLEHFSARAHSRDPRAIRRENAQALLEATYYKAKIAPQEIFSWWIEEIQESGPFDHPHIAVSLNNLANNLDGQGRYTEAEPLYRRALELSGANLPADHPDIAGSLNNLANNLDHQGRYAEAEPLHRHALELSGANLPADHPDIAGSLNNLANNLDHQGRYAEAEPLHRRALELRDANLPPNHPDIGGSMDNLASNLDRQGRYAEAEPLHRRALALMEANLPPTHPGMAASVNNLARHLDNQGRYAEAEPLHRRALALMEANLPPDHPHIAVSLNNLANNLDHQGRYAEAEPLHRRALALIEANLPPTHPGMAASLNNLARHLDNQGRYAEAEPLHRRALALMEANPPPDHPHIAVSLDNLANNLDNQGRYAEAEPPHRHALELREANLPSNHPHIANSLSNLGCNLDNQGRYAEAEPLHRRALALMEANLPPNHPDIAATLNNLASNLDYQGRHAEGEPLHRRALEIENAS
jgi:tetratricopeptide (TPR) repeat protein